MQRALGLWATAGAVASTLVLSASTALALQQPNGTVIPQSQNLVNFLNAEGETIDPLTEAATTPETFVPSCALTFKVIGRGAGQMNSFGWYNVTGQKPALTQLYEFITCSDAPGTVKVLDIKSDPRYTGGEIAFFQATTQGKNPPNCVNWNDLPGTLGYVFYSQKQYNDDNTGPNSWIHLLIMDSKAFANAFYFGWEDLFSGGDNDFEDLLMRVEGIQCSGGGGPCDTGQPGKCADGTLQCKSGQLECVPNVGPTPEVCNSRDDDCDTEIDEDGVCPPCSAGEFPCPSHLICSPAGVCVDPSCQGVSCATGEICVAGVCKEPCEGIVCPYAQVCREGVCVDPCESLSCDANYVCVLGVCQPGCGCSGCTGGQVCVAATEKCADPGCEDPAKCAAGTHCVAGQCVDDCAGATCPLGQSCVAGKCTQDADAGSSGGSGGSISFDGGIPGSGGSSASSSSGGSSGGLSRGGTEEEAGCGCRVAGSQRGSLAALAATAALLGLWLRRRAQLVRTSRKRRSR